MSDEMLDQPATGIDAIETIAIALASTTAATGSVIAEVQALRLSLRSLTDIDAYLAQFARIDRLRADPTNWSLSPVATPDAEQTDAARRGMLMLLLAHVPAPTMMLMNDGTFAAFWKRHDAYASIDFDADGAFPWTSADGLEVRSGVWTGGELPLPLRHAISG